MPDHVYDAVVVGARIAGASVAALLGDAGYRVLLVDRARFPSTTVSTHFFRGGGLVAVLERLRVLDQVLALGAPRLVHQYTYDDGETEAAVDPPQDPGEAGYCLSVRREPLDQILVQRAAGCQTVEFAEGTRCAGLIWDGERVTGARLESEEGERVVRARIVVGADGRRSAVARAVGAKEEVSDPPIRALFYRYVRGFSGPSGNPPDGPEFSLIGDEIAYVFPSDAGVACVALSFGQEEYARVKTSMNAYFGARIAAHRGLADRVDATTVLGKLLGCGPEPSWVRVPAGAGWALVGDAGLHQDPWSGLGMDCAGTHATFLAEALIDWFTGKASEDEALATYHTRRNEHSLPLYRLTIGHGRTVR